MTTGSTLLFTSVRNAAWLRLQGAGEPALTAEDDGVRAGGDGERRDGQQRTEDGLDVDGEQTAQDGDDDSRDRGHGKEPGTPSGGRDRERSRRLPQDGGGRHASVIGS